MKYGEFQEAVVKELQRHFGEGWKVSLVRVPKSNGKDYDGVQIMEKGDRLHVARIVNLASFYTLYGMGKADMPECIRFVCKELGGDIAWESEALMQTAGKVSDWNSVRGKIYPALLSASRNREYLKGMVHTDLLDLSVRYIMRKKLDDERDSIIGVTEAMLENYGVSREELHRKAIANLKQDGYQFRRMEDIVKETPGFGWDEIPERPEGMVRMYVLTNGRAYGAAGILHREMVRGFAQGKDYYILPSSIHETIFVPAEDVGSGMKMDAIVAEINEKEVAEEERLTNHSYYYDAGADAIRICA